MSKFSNTTSLSLVNVPEKSKSIGTAVAFDEARVRTESNEAVDANF
jgi:hypothetical protein